MANQTTQELYEEIRFENKYYSRVKDYLDNNEGFEIDPLFTPANARAHYPSGGGCAIYFTIGKRSSVILERRGDSNNMIGLVSIEKGNPLADEIKSDIAKLTQ